MGCFHFVREYGPSNETMFCTYERIKNVKDANNMKLCKTNDQSYLCRYGIYSVLNTQRATGILYHLGVMIPFQNVINQLNHLGLIISESL